MHYNYGGAGVLMSDGAHERILESKDKKPIYPTILHVLRQAREMQLRKKDDMLFSEYFIMPEDGGAPIATNTWSFYRSIVDFIHMVCRKEEYPDMWMTLKTLNPEMIATQIQKGVDAEIPCLQFNRLMFAVPNGIYYAGENVFVPRDPHTGMADTSGLGTDTNKVPCNYFESEIDPRHTMEEVDPRDIPTPAFQSILDYQDLRRPYHLIFESDRKRLLAAGVTPQQAEEMLHVEGVDTIERDRHDDPASGQPPDRVMEREMALTEIQRREALGLSAGEPTRSFTRERALIRCEIEAVCMTMYMLVGRMIFPLKMLDDMQVCMFINGLTRTGKSTIGMHIFSIFPEHLTRNLPATIEKIFGLDGFQDKYLFGCLEMKKTCMLDQTLLQSMISGERVTRARKNKVAEDGKWDLTGFFIGNEFGPWEDTSGCVSARFLTFFFNTVVPEWARDATVCDRMRAEMGAFLVKCVRLYLDFTADPTTEKMPALMRVPEYFRWSTLEMQKSLNPVFGIMCSGRYSIDRSRYVSFDDFRKEVSAEGLKMTAPDVRKAIETQPNTQIYLARASLPYGSGIVEQEYVIGLGFADETKRQDFANDGNVPSATASISTDIAHPNPNAAPTSFTSNNGAKFRVNAQNSSHGSNNQGPIDSQSRQGSGQRQNKRKKSDDGRGKAKSNPLLSSSTLSFRSSSSSSSSSSSLSSLSSSSSSSSSAKRKQQTTSTPLLPNVPKDADFITLDSDND